MSAAGLDAVLVTSAVGIRYYTNFTSDECAVIITHSGCVLVTDFRYTIQARELCGDCAEVIEAGYAAQRDVIRQVLSEDRCKTVGFEQDSMTVARFALYSDFQVQWKPFGAELHAPRLIKSASEIESLKKAQSYADKAFMQVLPRIKVGMSERELAAELTYLCGLAGSEGPSFDAIIAAGPNGAMCHAIPGNRKIANGDLIVMDFGCKADGYCSDMTRTVAVGHVDAEQKHIYQCVLDAQLRTVEALHAGISGKALDAVSRDYLTQKGFGENFGHGLGHGFGLEIHEPPRAATTSKDILEAGMTITIEPGVYIEGFCGARIEDCCVVTEGGCINLCSTDKQLIIL